MEQLFLIRLNTYETSVSDLIVDAKNLLQQAKEKKISPEELQDIANKLDSKNERFVAEMFTYYKEIKNPTSNKIPEYTDLQMEAEVIVAELRAVAPQGDLNMSETSVSDQIFDEKNLLAQTMENTISLESSISTELATLELENYGVQKQTPKQIQQDFYELLGDEDYFAHNVTKFEDKILLKHYISFALYGPPQDCERDEGIHTDIQPSPRDDKGVQKRKKHINDLCDIICRHGTNNEDPGLIAITTIFIVCELEKGECAPRPVFRLRKCFNSRRENCRIFIDDSGRVYKSWKDYKENNKLPKCRLIAPSNGKYEGVIINVEREETEVILETFMSPASSLASEALDVADKVGTGASIGATLVMGAGLVATMVSAVTVAPIVLGAAGATCAVTGVYSAARAGATLVDRRQHDQSVGLKNSESRGCWLGVVGGAVSVVSGGATKLLTRSVEKGATIGQATRALFNITAASNLVVNGAGVLNAGYQMFERHTNEEEITALDVFQFASSVLFFSHAAFTMKTANSIVTETQSSVLKDYESNLKSNRQRKMFRKAQKESQRLNGVQKGNAETIKGLQKIDDPHKFFASLVRGNKEFNKNKARFTISKDGQIEINGSFRIDPSEFQSLGLEGRQEIFSSIPAADTKIPKARFSQGQQYVQNQFLRTLKLENISLPVSNIIVVMLNPYSKTVKNIITDVVKMLCDRVRGDLSVQIKKTFPNHSKVIVLLDFLLNYCQIKVHGMVERFHLASKKEVYDFYKKMFFKLLRNIKSVFENAIEDIKKWIAGKLEKISRIAHLEGMESYQALSSQYNTILVKCSVCHGCFYQSL